jgi:hypothetical protein
LHGRIHESAGVDKVGNTKVVNPGSEYEDGILDYALIAIKRDIKGFGKFYAKKYVVKTVHLERG